MALSRRQHIQSHMRVLNSPVFDAVRSLGRILRLSAEAGFLARARLAIGRHRRHFTAAISARPFRFLPRQIEAARLLTRRRQRRQTATR